MKGIVIGAGIGGLATAIAMQKRNIPVSLYESASALLPVGAGILVPPNAMTVLGRYGLAEAVRDNGHPIASLVLADAKGREIAKSPAIYAKGGSVHQTVAVHRGKLQSVLLASLTPNALVTAKKCIRARTTRGGAEVAFADGTRAQGDFIVGADGIRSSVRESIFPGRPLRYSGQTCWRGVANMTLSDQWSDQLTEVWGRGVRFGFVQIAPTQVYWYATKLEASGGVDDRALLKENLLRSYGEFMSPVMEIISRTEVSAIIRDDLSDLSPMKSWSSGAIVLMGDAAHASTPNLGQGGAQAIEDSWALAESVRTSGTAQEAFARFQASRFARVNRVVDVSWRLGKMANLSGRWSCGVRDMLFRSVPSFVARKQSRMLYDVAF